MEIPEKLRTLVDQIGQALVQAMVNDPRSRELAKQIQTEGFEVALMLEATVALRQHTDMVRDESEVPEDQDPVIPMLNELPGEESLSRLPPMANFFREESEARPATEWSEADKAFLRTFKISLE